jgi:PTH1 family peptidyl-tRNA hydrolase
LRIGIDPTPPGWETVDYVLSKFSAAEREIVDDGLARAGEAVVSWLTDGVDVAMNVFNRDSRPPQSGV